MLFQLQFWDKVVELVAASAASTATSFEMSISVGTLRTVLPFGFARRKAVVGWMVVMWSSNIFGRDQLVVRMSLVPSSC